MGSRGWNCLVWNVVFFPLLVSSLVTVAFALVADPLPVDTPEFEQELGALRR
jgi:hypothetical protein